jgi:hypothetical protein
MPGRSANHDCVPLSKLQNAPACPDACRRHSAPSRQANRRSSCNSVYAPAARRDSVTGTKTPPSSLTDLNERLAMASKAAKAPERKHLAGNEPAEQGPAHPKAARRGLNSAEVHPRSRLDPRVSRPCLNGAGIVAIDSSPDEASRVDRPLVVRQCFGALSNADKRPRAPGAKVSSQTVRVSSGPSRARSKPRMRQSFFQRELAFARRVSCISILSSGEPARPSLPAAKAAPRPSGGGCTVSGAE